MRIQLFLFVLLVINGSCLHAQQTDSLGIFKHFYHINKHYQQPPYQVKIIVKRYLLQASQVADTIKSEAEYVMNQHTAYIKSDQVEEIANDSMALLVNKQLKRMQLIQRENAQMGSSQNAFSFEMNDTSLVKLYQQFQAVESKVSPQMNLIEFDSHQLIENLNLPRQSIQLFYQPSTEDPVKILLIKRSFQFIDSSKFQHLLRDSTYRNRIIVYKGHYYKLMEEVMEWNFINIRHEAKLVPVDIYERISKTSKGYLPAKGYENYLLNQN